MKNVTALFSALFIVLLFTTARANDPKTAEGSKCVYTSINSLTDLSFDDASIGFQYLFANRQGVNVSLGFISNSTDVGSATVKSSMFNITLGYINYIFQNGPVALYLNPYIGISSGSNDDNHIETTGLDVILGIGAEWWAFENVSLAAQFALGYSSTTTENTQVTNSEVKESSIGILGSGAGRFYLTFYF